MTFQAFIDDSHSENGAFVLGGHIASAESWAEFSKEWGALLRSAGTIATNGIYHFKMSEMALYPHRMERVPAFYWVIEKYVLMSLSCKINLGDFDRAKKQVQNLMLDLRYKVDFDSLESPYRFAFRCLIDMFHNHRTAIRKIIPLDQKVDFVFDDQSEKRVILAAWSDYIAERPDEIRDYYGTQPRFENDQEFLPLQAADFWAWWVREWYEEDAVDLPEKMEKFDFGKWKGEIRPSVAISFNEEQIAEALLGLAIEHAVYAKLEGD
jgi:hypothetical protein